MATLTFAYADRAAVLGQLATYAEPHTYDLCADHAVRLTAPRGWNVIRLADNLPEDPDSGRGASSDQDDLFDLAEALRPQRVGGPPGEASAAAATESPVEHGEIGRRGHLRVLRGHE